MNANATQTCTETSPKEVSGRLGLDPALVEETVIVRLVGWELDLGVGQIVVLGDAGITFRSNVGWKRFMPWSIVASIRPDR
jgi:hypothetical protein